MSRHRNRPRRHHHFGRRQFGGVLLGEGADGDVAGSHGGYLAVLHGGDFRIAGENGASQGRLTHRSSLDCCFVAAAILSVNHQGRKNSFADVEFGY
jgi:hypothetical protein